MYCSCLTLSNSRCLKGGDDRDLRLLGHVGFDSFPDQLVTKCVNKGFDFNVLCIGKWTHSCGRYLSHHFSGGFTRGYLLSLRQCV